MRHMIGLFIDLIMYVLLDYAVLSTSIKEPST